MVSRCACAAELGAQGLGLSLPGCRAGGLRRPWTALPLELSFAQKCDEMFVRNA